MINKKTKKEQFTDDNKENKLNYQVWNSFD